MIVTIIGTVKRNGIVFHAIQTFSPDQNRIQAYADNEAVGNIYLTGSKCSSSETALEALHAIADNDQEHWATQWATSAESALACS